MEGKESQLQLIPSSHHYLHILYTLGALSSPSGQFGTSDQFLPSLLILFSLVFFALISTQLSDYCTTAQEYMGREKFSPMDLHTLFLFLLDSMCMGNNIVGL